MPHIAFNKLNTLKQIKEKESLSLKILPGDIRLTPGTEILVTLSHSSSLVNSRHIKFQSSGFFQLFEAFGQHNHSWIKDKSYVILQKAKSHLESSASWCSFCVSLYLFYFIDVPFC